MLMKESNQDKLCSTAQDVAIETLIHVHNIVKLDLRMRAATLTFCLHCIDLQSVSVIRLQVIAIIYRQSKLARTEHALKNEVKLEKARKKAESITDSVDVTDNEKTQQIYKKVGVLGKERGGSKPW